MLLSKGSADKQSPKRKRGVKVRPTQRARIATLPRLTPRLRLGL